MLLDFTGAAWFIGKPLVSFIFHWDESFRNWTGLIRTLVLVVLCRRSSGVEQLHLLVLGIPSTLFVWTLSTSFVCFVTHIFTCC